MLTTVYSDSEQHILQASRDEWEAVADAVPEQYNGLARLIRRHLGAATGAGPVRIQMSSDMAQRMRTIAERVQ